MVCFSASLFHTWSAEASGTIYIRADGRVDPETTAISTLDKVTFVFTGNITDSIVIEKNNIIVEGKGYSLRGMRQYGSRGIGLSGRTNVTVRNTVITGFWSGIYAETGASSNILSGNEITSNDNGILLSNSSNNSVFGNQIVDNVGGIDLAGSSHNSILGNNVTNNNYGILISGASYNNISQNQVTDNTSFGVSLGSYSSNNTLWGNNITDNGTNGLFVWTSSENEISENRIAGNDYGVYLEDSSNNTISRNQIAENNYGIFLWGSDNTIIENRIMVNHFLGLSVYSPSSDNRISHNDLINNALQADASGPNGNIWDYGYPSGGNYWSDYAGPDEKAGPDQDQPGPDGISDTPYIIDSNNTDHYPLMGPYADVAPPSTTHDYDGAWHTADFTITLTASDDTNSGSVTYYRINEGPSRKVSTEGQPQIAVESGNNVLEYWSRDRAGNEETPHKILTRIRLDKTPPTGSITINDSLLYTNSTSVTLTVSAIDATSGVSQVRFSGEDATWTSWEQYSPSKPWILPAVDGRRIVRVELVDEAGLSSQYQDEIILDTTRPSANAGLDRVVEAGAEVTLDASSSSDENGITSYTWTFTDETSKALNGRSVKYTFSTSGTYAITLGVSDTAGNTASSIMILTIVPGETSPHQGTPPIWTAVALAAVLMLAIPAVIIWKRRKRPTDST